VTPAADDDDDETETPAVAGFRSKTTFSHEEAVMTITVQKLQRSFAYNGIALPDPGCELSPEQVRDVYSATYPEITTASIEGPEQKGERLVYTFRRAVGTKGAVSANSPRTSRVVVRRRDDGLTYVEPTVGGNLDGRSSDHRLAAMDRVDRSLASAS
jgi:PRTRC genetic system protein C